MNKKAYARLLSVVMGVTCLCLSLATIAASEFKIITLQYRFAEDILPAIQPLLTPDGTASAMQNHLIIRTNANNMTEIEQVIATLDVERKNITITVRRDSAKAATDSNTNIDIHKRIGDVEITSGTQTKTNRYGTQIQIENRQSNIQNHSDQSITTTEGEQAFIRAGQSIPFTQEWIVLSTRYFSRQQTTAFVDVDTGFAVRPRSIGNQIELEITPRVSQLNNSGHLDFETLTTTVRLSRGVWLDLGSLMQSKDEVSRKILSRSNNVQSENNRISVRVD